MSPKFVELDGRVGEGGGQIIRIAVGLAALTGIPLRIHHVRGNRGRRREGGLKAQHVACIRYLGLATDADVTNCFVGATEFTFTPKRKPHQLVERNIIIDTEGASSILLVLQSILPFLLYAHHDDKTPIRLTLHGGTNVSFSLSFEYLDQVLMPALEMMGVPKIDRTVSLRGWSHGVRQVGSATFVIHPIPAGTTLQARWPSNTDPGPVQHIRMSLIVPNDMRQLLQTAITLETSRVFPGVDLQATLVENSRSPARIYILLVATTEVHFSLGHDLLFAEKRHGRADDTLAADIARKVVRGLSREVKRGGVVDEHLQDQLVIFQALAEGRSNICTAPAAETGVDSTKEPFGQGSMHTKTARWVVSQMLSNVRFSDDGTTCDGIGWKSI